MPKQSPPELDQFLQAYPGEVGQLFKATRERVLKAAKGCNEIIYDAYSAVASGFTFTEGFQEAFCHIAAYGKYVNLGFNNGAQMDDPAHVLQGSGKFIRHITIKKIEDLNAAPVAHFIALAVEQGQVNAKGKESAKGKVFIKQTKGPKRRPNLLDNKNARRTKKTRR
jgi:hypothetical protein